MARDLGEVGLKRGLPNFRISSGPQRQTPPSVASHVYRSPKKRWPSHRPFPRGVDHQAPCAGRCPRQSGSSSAQRGGGGKFI